MKFVVTLSKCNKNPSRNRWAQWAWANRPQQSAQSPHKSCTSSAYSSPSTNASCAPPRSSSPAAPTPSPQSSPNASASPQHITTPKSKTSLATSKQNPNTLVCPALLLELGSLLRYLHRHCWKLIGIALRRRRIVRGRWWSWRSGGVMGCWWLGSMGLGRLYSYSRWGNDLNLETLWYFVTQMICNAIW